MSQKSRLESHRRPARPPFKFMVRSFLGAVIGIGSLAFLDRFGLNNHDLTFVIGAFGATAVLVYGAPNSPLAQPYNVVVGHIVSAFMGVLMFKLIGDVLILAAPLAVASAIFMMQVTRSLHPPGGASALIAVVASSSIHDLGFWYVLYPVGAGAVILILIAIVVNSVGAPYRWPDRWI